MLLVYHFIQTEKAMLYKECIYKNTDNKIEHWNSHNICFDLKFMALFMHMSVYLFCSTCMSIDKWQCTCICIHFECES